MFSLWCKIIQMNFRFEFHVLTWNDGSFWWCFKPIELKFCFILEMISSRCWWREWTTQRCVLPSGGRQMEVKVGAWWAHLALRTASRWQWAALLQIRAEHGGPVSVPHSSGSKVSLRTGSADTDIMRWSLTEDRWVREGCRSPRAEAAGRSRRMCSRSAASVKTVL